MSFIYGPAFACSIQILIGDPPISNAPKSFDFLVLTALWSRNHSCLWRLGSRSPKNFPRDRAAANFHRFLLPPATSRLPRPLPPSDCKSVLPLARSGVKEEHGEVHIAIVPEDDELALFQRVILHELAPAGGKECAFPVSPQIHTPFASAGAVKEDDRFGLCDWTWNVFQKLWGNPLQQIQRASKQKSKRHRRSSF